MEGRTQIPIGLPPCENAIEKEINIWNQITFLTFWLVPAISATAPGDLKTLVQQDIQIMSYCTDFITLTCCRTLLGWKIKSYLYKAHQNKTKLGKESLRKRDIEIRNWRLEKTHPYLTERINSDSKKSLWAVILHQKQRCGEKQKVWKEMTISSSSEQLLTKSKRFQMTFSVSVSNPCATQALLQVANMISSELLSHSRLGHEKGSSAILTVQSAGLGSAESLHGRGSQVWESTEQNLGWSHRTW